MNVAGLSTKKQAEEVVETVFDNITRTLTKGENVSIAGFGIFRVDTRKARVGVSPKPPHEKIQIPSKRVAKFKPGQQLKDAVA